MAATAGWMLDGSAMARMLAQAACAEPVAAGELLGVVPLTGDRPRPTPFGEAVGGPGLDTRVFTDLSRIGPERLVTPTAEVFVRTAAPPQVSGRAATWSVALEGGGGPDRVAIEELRSASRPLTTTSLPRAAYVSASRRPMPCVPPTMTTAPALTAPTLEALCSLSQLPRRAIQEPESRI